MLKYLLFLNTRSFMDSYKRILKASLGLFAEFGFHGTSIRKIANEAKVSLGLTYNYFGSKEDLFKEVILQNYKYLTTGFAGLKQLKGKKRISKLETLVLANAIKNREVLTILNAAQYHNDVRQLLPIDLGNFYDQLKSEIEIAYDTGKEKATPKSVELTLATIVGLIDLRLRFTSFV